MLVQVLRGKLVYGNASKAPYLRLRARYILESKSHLTPPPH